MIAASYAGIVGGAIDGTVGSIAPVLGTAVGVAV